MIIKSIKYHIMKELQTACPEKYNEINTKTKEVEA